jgi:hypothetical protein
MDSVTKQQVVNRVRHEAREKGTLKEDKHLLLAIQEMEKYDWNPSMRLLLLIIAMGQRVDPKAWIQEDCPRTAEEMVGWCDFAQWRLAQRVGVTEKHIQKMLQRLKGDGFLHIKVWKDSNNAMHGMYQIIEASVMAAQRPTNKANTKRGPRYSEKREGNKGSFSKINQPGRSAKQQAIMEEDGE